MVKGQDELLVSDGKCECKIIRATGRVRSVTANYKDTFGSLQLDMLNDKNVQPECVIHMLGPIRY